MELLVGGPYTRDKEEHLFGHAALRVVVGSKDITYDFGRYGKTWGTFDSEGEGVLNVWTSFKTYISGENSLGRTTTGFVYNLERSKAEPRTVSRDERSFLGREAGGSHAEMDTGRYFYAGRLAGYARRKYRGAL